MTKTSKRGFKVLKRHPSAKITVLVSALYLAEFQVLMMGHPCTALAVITHGMAYLVRSALDS